MITISPMKDKDIATVVEIEKACFNFPKPETIFREDEHKYLIAKEEDGRIAGYIGVEKILDEVHIINMAVHPDFRGTGIGKRRSLFSRGQGFQRNG
jgi:[ribosomal protein S18]-alanine N-acetyltransferase